MSSPALTAAFSSPNDGSLFGMVANELELDAKGVYTVHVTV